MSNSDFDKDSIYLGLSIGVILGIILAAVAANYGVEKQRQTECKKLDGIQICRDIDYFPWKVKEEEAKRVEDYNFAYSRYKTMEQVYKHEAEEYHYWQHFGFKYGCRSPEEMRVLIDDLVRKINELEQFKLEQKIKEK